MCGIWGSLGAKPSRRVIEAVAHRGPDGHGWREFDTPAGPLVLAHRRLAIIDTSDAGAQPMDDADRRYTIVFNGIIYNYIELREELTASGHRFQSQSDTEVLLAAYAEWGEGCLRRLNGMFAFALWDTETETLVIARDRFGIKPLYYAAAEGVLAFASEIKQLLELDSVSARLNPETAFDFLAHGMIDHGPDTLFTGIRSVPAGTMAAIKTSDRPGAIQWKSWYDRPEPGSLRLSADDAISRFRELMDDSVALRLRSDVGIGFCLSGGLDSSTIVSLAAPRLNGGGPVTVSACYEGFDNDESHFIDIVNNHTGARPCKISPSGKELANAINALHYHQEAPVTNAGVFTQWRVFEAAAEAGVKVMLDGQGADEQLGGYHTAFPRYHAGLLRSLRWTRLTRELAGRKRRHGEGVTRQIARLLAAALPGGIRGAVDSLAGRGAPEWLSKSFSGAQSPRPPIGGSFSKLMLSQLFETSLPMLLRYEDRNSMAHGIESRLPFLDYRLVDFLVSLGDEHKIRDGETKWLLRRAMTGRIPEDILGRQDKVAFAVPQTRWLAGPAAGLLNGAGTEARERFPGLFSGPGLDRLSDNFFSNPGAFADEAWRLVSFAAWARVFNITE